MRNTNDEFKGLEAENEQLKKLNQMLLTVIDNINYGVYAVDENDTIVLYNSKIEQTEGRKRSEMLGRDEKMVCASSEPHYNYNDIATAQVKKTKRPLLNSVIRYALNDNICNVALDVHPFFYEGKFSGVISISLDQKQLNEMYNNASKMGKRLLSFVDHEQEESDGFGELIGECDLMKEAINLARQIAMRDSPVMIIGDTGTGKELFARDIHRIGLYKDGPFVPVNCAAIPDTLLESILFGTVKGAFTGATDAPGLFEQADGGTIFLDEINAMPLQFQAKLLRVIQDKKVRRVGSHKETPINCRIVSATNTDPFHNDNVFRPDLFFRLAVINIHIPPLRQRGEDILLLADFFIRRFNKRFPTGIAEMDDALKQMLLRYDWPGNVRELENIIESSMNFVEEKETVLRVGHIPVYFREKLVAPSSTLKNRVKGRPLREQMQQFEKQLLFETLQDNNWNISRAARDLGMQRQNLQAKIKKYGFEKQ
jgi:arginine utilization regulatory protein